MTQQTPNPEYDRRPKPRSRVPFLALRITWPFMWFIFAVILVVGVAILANGGFSDNGFPRIDWMEFFADLAVRSGLVIGPFILLYCAIISVLLLKLFRRRRADLIIGYLDQAARLNLPLPQFLAAAARSESGTTGRRLVALGQALSSGYPLANALRGTVPELSQRAVALVAAGENSGHLTTALDRLVAEERSRRQPHFDRRAFLIFYPAALLLLGAITFLGLIVFIMPKFREIFNDFRMTMPLPTRWLLAISDALQEVWVLALVLLLTILFLWWLGRLLAEIFAPHWSALQRRSWLKDALLWVLPLAHSTTKNQGLADVLEVIGSSARAGVPLSQALHQASELGINRVLARRIGHLELAVERGTPLPEAARLAGLPNLISGMWTTAQASASFPESCAFLARYYRGKFLRTAIFLQAAIEPAVVLLMGTLVALIALSVIAALAQLIGGVTGMWSIQ